MEAADIGAAAPVRVEPIVGGHSNLTYRVWTENEEVLVLRRPPLGETLATAHDMARESRIFTALAGTDVPVPLVLGCCDDPSVIGAPFFVMDYVDGQVIRDGLSASQVDPAVRRRAGEAVAEVLASIHELDPAAIGLGDLGRTDGYVERQLHRWHRQFRAVRSRPLPQVDEVYACLLTRIPAQGGTALVHGDYRLDNCILDATGEVASVLDWELATLGDPLADVGLLLAYWAEAGDEDTVLPDAPTAHPGFPSRAEVLDRYSMCSGRDVTGIDFYVALAYWKLACIVEGVLARYAAGAMADDSHDFSVLADRAERCAAEAARVAGRLS